MFSRPVWARGWCRISPPHFLAECCKRQLNQVSLVLLYFRLSTFSDLYWVCLSVFSCTVLFVSISQVIGCEVRLRNDLYCVEWGVKLYSSQDPCTRRRAVQSYVRLLWPLVWRIAGVLLSLASLLRIMHTSSLQEAWQAAFRNGAGYDLNGALSFMPSSHPQPDKIRRSCLCRIR